MNPTVSCHLRPLFVAKMRKAEAACPCRLPGVHGGYVSRCICICSIGQDQGGPCGWPGHDAHRALVIVWAHLIWCYAPGAVYIMEIVNTYEEFIDGLLKQCGMPPATHEEKER